MESLSSNGGMPYNQIRKLLNETAGLSDNGAALSKLFRNEQIMLNIISTIIHDYKKVFKKFSSKQKNPSLMDRVNKTILKREKTLLSLEGNTKKQHITYQEILGNILFNILSLRIKTDLTLEDIFHMHDAYSSLSSIKVDLKNVKKREDPDYLFEIQHQGKYCIIKILDLIQHLNVLPENRRNRSDPYDGIRGELGDALQ